MKKQIDLKYLIKLLFKNKKLLFLGQILTVIAILISIPIPLLLPILVDEVLLKKPDIFVNNVNVLFGELNAFLYIFIALIIVVLLRLIHFVFSVFITKIFTKISKYVTFKIRQKVLKHLKKVIMNEYETIGTGSITANLITDVNTLDTFIVSSASKFVSSILTLIAVAIVIITINPILGLMIICIQPVVMILSKKISKKTGILKKEENKAIEDFQNNLTETLDLIGQIKASNKEELFFKKSIYEAKNIQKTSNEFNYRSVAYERFSFTIFLIAFEIFRASGLILVAYSDLSIGMMFAMFGYIWFIMTPVQDILTIQYSYASANAAMQRINTILNLKTEKNAKELIKNDKIEVSIEKLNFSYNEGRNILKNISIKIKSGEKIALIGASGSGKTTLAQIIASFYDKNGGDIKYNGISIDNLDKKSIRKKVFLVLQMPMLFNNTLRFNITMGDKISDEHIYSAIKIAQLENVLKDLPLKLDTVIGKNGVRLSGGQRQRLSIARMIVTNPSIIIFDESTSALDVHTEAKLYNDLKKFLEDKTVITIAHRLSTIKNAQKIYVLNNGQIVQEGSHKDLEEQEGHYLNFIKEQLV